MASNPISRQPPKAATEAAKRPSDAEIAPLLGGYHDETNETYPWIVRQGERVALEVPGQAVLALDWPDAGGVWKTLAASNVAVKFDRDASGAVASMTISQGEASRTMPRRVAPRIARAFAMPIDVRCSR